MSNNRVKIKLEQIAETDENRKAGIIYRRNDAVALARLCNAIDGKAVKNDEYTTWISLADKFENAVIKKEKDVEVSIDEISFLKRMLNNPHNDSIPITIFYARTIQGIKEQLK